MANYVIDEKGCLRTIEYQNDTVLNIPEGVVRVGAERAYSGVFGNLYNVPVKAVVIPEGVTAIGEYSFRNCNKLQRVVLPSTLEVIDGLAFYGCDALEELVFPEKLKTIGNSAFFCCKNLKRIVLPAGLQLIRENAFYGCDALEEVVGLHEGVTLEDGVLGGCGKLADSKGFAIVQDILFGYFGQEEQVTVPAGVKRISNSAFSRNTQLKSVTIHDGVTHLGTSVFNGCTALTEVQLPEGVEMIPYSAFQGCTALTDVKLPASTKIIRNNAFRGCTALKHIQLPEGLKEIYGDAFYGCEELEEVTLPDTVELLSGFVNCAKLAKLNMPAGLKKISNLDECKKLTALRLPKGVEYSWMPFRKDLLIIPGDVYADAADTKGGKPWNASNVLFTVGTEQKTACRLLLNEKFEKLQCYGKKTGFQWKVYDGLLVNNEAKLPAPLLTLAMLCRLRWSQELAEDKKQYFAEYVTKNLKKVAPYANLIPEDGLVSVLEQIGALTDKNKKTILPLMGIGEAPAPKKKAEKKSADAPDGVKTPAQIKKEWNTKKLEDGTLGLTCYKGTDTVVEIPAMIGSGTVTMVGKEALTCSPFGRVTKEQQAIRQRITAVVVPEGITEIGEEAFYQCSYLESVTLPSTLQKIGPMAFASCPKLKNLVIPPNVVMEGGAFRGCKSLADEQGLVIVNGVLYNCYAGGDVVVPGAVKRVESQSFRNLEDLNSIEFPEGLKSLPAWMIGDCKNLKTVTIPASVKEIGNSSFSGGLTVRGYTGSAAETYARRNVRMVFESIGVLIDNQGDFVIDEEMLIEYKGKKPLAQIPDGVTVIGGRKSGYYGIRGAFSGSDVEKVVIPSGVREIWSSAFYGCKSLREIEIPDTVEQVGTRAFQGTPWLNQQPAGPLYVGRALYGYCAAPGEAGPDTLVVREGTKTVTAEAYWCDKYLKKLVLPEGLERVGDDAFSCCRSLEEVVAPASLKELGEKAFSEVTLKRCSGGVLHKTEKLPARFKVFYTGDPEDTAWVNLYQGEPAWRKAIREKMDTNPDSAEGAMRKMAEMINAMPALDKAVGNRAASFAQELYATVGSEALKAIYEALKAKKHASVKKLDLDEKFKAAMEGTAQEDLSKLHPVEAKVVQSIKMTPAFNKVLSRIVEGVPYAGTQELCAPRVLAFIAYEYIRQFDPESTKYVSEYANACTAYALSEAADEVAAALDQNALQDALVQLAQQYEGEYYLPCARYADDKHTVSLLSQMREWDNWNRYGAIGRKNIITLRSGLLLNDTKAAMLHMDKVGCLGLYAKLRGTDADTLRDTVLADFGFDENREIRYDLGGNTVTVRMDTELNLVLFDTNAGKTVKSIPKKGADAELHAKAKSAFSDLKKNIKKVVTNRRHLLFADFLSGETKQVDKWKQSYIGNPVLNSVARLLVWTQEGRTFTLTLDGAVDSAGEPYEITDAPIAVAHPIEMRGEIAAWQEYFTSRSLKQPFEQIWEPAYRAEDILPDRYDGCSLNVYRLANKEAHGIRVWGLQAYSEEYGFELTDCAMEQEGSEWRFVSGITDDATFSLGKFTFEKLTRYVNHIVYLFDKWTVTDRLLKDEVAVEASLAAFTAAQIRELIHLTTEKGCTNASAMLLNYQNQHFGDIDPLAEFTLDL